MKQNVSNQMDGGLNTEQTLITEFQDSGKIPVSYDQFIVQDIFEFVKQKGHSLDEYYVRVSKGSGSYAGINRFLYANAILALQNVINAKLPSEKRSESYRDAIAFLHQDMKLAPNTIRNIVKMLGVDLTIRKILQHSEKVFTARYFPKGYKTLEVGYIERI